MIIVLSLGGSLINTEKGVDKEYLERIKRIVEKSKHKFGIVSGGGYKAREYIKEVRSAEGTEFEADMRAIEATRENAKELINILGKKIACPKVPKEFEEAKKALEKYKVVVMGGTIPGITTDSDAVLLAECLEAERVINVSNVDGVYNKDPNKNTDAKKFHYLTHEELIKLSSENDKRIAGTNFVFDILACKLALRSKIELHFISGKNLGDLERAIEGEDHSGTIIK